MKGIKTINKCLILFFLVLGKIAAQPCANAGKDSLVCGLTYNLVGSPTGGDWNYICNDTSYIVKFDTIFPGVVKVSANRCGEYRFTYSVGSPCPSTDTVVIKFENKTFKIEELSQKLNLEYPIFENYNSPIDSCGNLRIISGKAEINPNWKFDITGSCENFGIHVNVVNKDLVNCLADTIIYGIDLRRDTSNFKWTSLQSSFLTKDSTGNIIDNRFINYLNILSDGVLKDLDTKCPLNKCYLDANLCLDPVKWDTLKIPFPVHCGGRWHLIKNKDTIALNNSNIIVLDSNKYELNLVTGAKYYGPDNLQFELYLLDTMGNRVKLNATKKLSIIWKEEWKYDTIRTLFPREFNDDNCRCNGKTINISALNIPKIPTAHFTPIELKFSNNLNPKILGNDYYCEDYFVKLKADKPYKLYKWSNGESTIECSVFAEKTYYLEVEDSLGCKGIDSIFVREIQKPDFAIDASATSICSGDCVTLEIKTDTSNIGIWNNTDTSKIFTNCPPLSQTFFAKAINKFGCITEDQISIEVKFSPDPHAGDDKEITCLNNIVRLQPIRTDASAKGRYFFWTGPGINSFNRDSLNPLVNLPGAYVLHTRDSSLGCSGFDTVIVKDNRIQPKSNAGIDSILNCKYTSIELHADSSDIGAGYFLKWTGPSISPSNQGSVNPKISLPGVYVLKVTNIANGCESIDSVLIKQDIDKPNSDAGLDKLLFCDSTGRTLGGQSSSVGNQYEYLWLGSKIDTNNNKQQLYFAKDTGLYTLIVTNKINYCQDTDLVKLTAPLQFPKAKIVKSGDIQCRIDSINLSANTSIGSNLTYQWQNASIPVSSRNKISINVALAGTYVLQITDTTTHCTSTDTITVKNLGGVPTGTGGQDKKITCDNDQIVLEGEIDKSKFVFFWQGAGINFSNVALQKPVVDKPDTYLLYITDTSINCTFIDTVRVTKELNKPSVNLGPDLTLNCAIDSLDVLAQMINPQNYYFQWVGKSIATGNERMVRQTIKQADTLFFFISTPNKECFVQDTLIIKIDTTKININIQDTFKLSCHDSTVIIDKRMFSSIDSIIWKKGNQTIQNTQNGKYITLNQAGNYTYTVYQKNGCRHSGIITVLPYSKAIYSYTVTKSCVDKATGTVQINVKNGSGLYYFRVGNVEDTTSLIKNLKGIVKIYIIGKEECNIDSFVINIPEHPAFPNIRPFDTLTLCTELELFGPSVILDNKTTPVKYQWSNGKNTPIITVDEPGIYTLTITDANNCSSAISTFEVNQQSQTFDDIFKMPNVFTPDGNNENDFFLPYMENYDLVTDYKLQIYNRWGQLIFETTTPKSGWNGEYNNERSRIDTYIYVVSGKLEICNKTENFKLKGDVTLIR